MRQTDAYEAHCAVCRPTEPWKRRTETCCAEHREILETAETIRKGTATGQWEPQGPERAKEGWRNRAERVTGESDYRRHWLHCIVAQGGRCGDPQKDTTGKGCGRHLLALPAVSVHVDHIVPRNEGGRDDWENCQALCSDCNLRAGDGSREDSPIREAQRIWEAAKPPDIVRQAREQEGRCARCGKWLWSIEETNEQMLADENILICDPCHRVEIETRKNRQREITTRKKMEILEERNQVIQKINKKYKVISNIMIIIYLSVSLILPFLLLLNLQKQYSGSALELIFSIIIFLVAIYFFPKVMGYIADNIVSRWRECELKRKLGLLQRDSE